MNVNGNAGRYDMTAVLGEGGMATVWRAYDRQLGREVALKALQPHLARNPVVQERFIQEAHALASLRHPNIVSFYDVDATADRPYYAMERIDGPTLAHLLKAEGPRPPAQVAAWLRPLASAVDYLHAAGFVHRDIKAANIMLDSAGRIVLMDFGIARALDGTHHTLNGASIGTVETMAPEQVLNEPAGPPADIYALGILAYQLLAGRPPFTGSSGHVLYAHVHLPPPPLRAVRPEISPALETAILQALAKDPAQRPATAGAFASAVAAAAVPPAAMPLPIARPAPAEPPALPDKRPATTTATGSKGTRRPLIAGAVTAIALLAATLGALLFVAADGIATDAGRSPTVVAANNLNQIWSKCAAPGVARDAYIGELLRLNPKLDPNPDTPIPDRTGLTLPSDQTIPACNGAAAGSATPPRTGTRASPTPTGPSQYTVNPGDAGLPAVWQACAADGTDFDAYLAALLPLNPTLENNAGATLQPGQVVKLPASLTKPVCGGLATPPPPPPPPAGSATAAQPATTPAPRGGSTTAATAPRGGSTTAAGGAGAPVATTRPNAPTTTSVPAASTPTAAANVGSGAAPTQRTATATPAAGGGAATATPASPATPAPTATTPAPAASPTTPPTRSPSDPGGNPGAPGGGGGGGSTPVTAPPPSTPEQPALPPPPPPDPGGGRTPLPFVVPSSRGDARHPRYPP